MSACRGRSDKIWDVGVSGAGNYRNSGYRGLWEAYVSGFYCGQVLAADGTSLCVVLH